MTGYIETLNIKPRALDNLCKLTYFLQRRSYTYTSFYCAKDCSTVPRTATEAATEQLLAIPVTAKSV